VKYDFLTTFREREGRIKTIYPYAKRGCKIQVQGGGGGGDKRGKKKEVSRRAALAHAPKISLD